MNRSRVVIELAGDAQFSRDLAAGGVFVPGCALGLTEECDLVVRGANHQIVVPARVVYVDKQRGAGLELIGFSPEMKAQLAELEPVAPPELEFIEEPAIDESPLDGPMLDEPAPLDDDLGRSGAPEPILLDLEALDDASDDNFSLPVLDDGDSAPPDDDTYAGVDARSADAGDPDLARANAARASAAFSNADTLPPKRAGERDADGAPDQADPGFATRSFARAVHERLRGLTLAAQLKIAVSGELHERIVLERMYGKNVWETLLRNPRLTPPEVARIARYGSLPRVLLEIIVGNNAWLQLPEVRRALLSNPRLATDQIMKVLRLTPKPELKIAAIQTAYPYAVRNAAKMMIVRDD